MDKAAIVTLLLGYKNNPSLTPVGNAFVKGAEKAIKVKS